MPENIEYRGSTFEWGNINDDIVFMPAQHITATPVPTASEWSNAPVPPDETDSPCNVFIHPVGPPPNDFMCSLCFGVFPDASRTHLERPDSVSVEICPGCASRAVINCPQCGVRWIGNRRQRNRYGARICDDCANCYRSCEQCGETFATNNPNSRATYCPICASNRVLEYNARPNTIPIGDGKIHFGIELEMECRDSSVYRNAVPVIQSRLSEDFAIIKHDGSLNLGFEVVSRPASMAIHRKEWKNLLSERIAGIKAERTETCGCHIHCSRRPMSELQVAKIVCFTNCNANRSFMQVIAGRLADRWARMSDKKLADGNKANEVRYEAVNLQNIETVEFRIFKGTVRYETLMKNLEFCDALCSFSSPASMPLQVAMDREAFIRFIHAERRYSREMKRSVLRWPHLVAFVDAKWLGIATKLTKKFGFACVSKKEVLDISL